MLKTGSEIGHFSPATELHDAPPREPVVEPPRDYTPFAILQRKISSRLARHVPLARRRLFNPRPMVSFTFDDAPVSALSIGAPMLEASGGRGTYYIASGLMGRKTSLYQVIDRDDVRNLHARGHEIGLHGHSHCAVGRLSPQEFLDDLALNRAQLDGIDGSIQAKNFAYPFGMAAFARKQQLSSLVHSSRSVFPGVNSADIDPHFLKCVELTNKWLTLEKLRAHLDAVVKQNGWLIFLTHDVSTSPSPYGCSPDFFRRALDGAAVRGVEIVTIAQALSRSHQNGGLFVKRAQ